MAIKDLSPPRLGFSKLYGQRIVPQLNFRSIYASATAIYAAEFSGNVLFFADYDKLYRYADQRLTEFGATNGAINAIHVSSKFPDRLYLATAKGVAIVEKRQVAKMARNGFDCGWTKECYWDCGRQRWPSLGINEPGRGAYLRDVRGR